MCQRCVEYAQAPSGQYHGITVLIDTDDNYTEPTGANIRQALHDLISKSAPGDILYFHYSGHGTRVPADDDENDETGYDECIAPSDLNLINGMCHYDCHSLLDVGIESKLA